MTNREENPADFSRRQFLQLLSALGVTGGIAGNAGAGVLTSLAVIPDIENPL